MLLKDEKRPKPPRGVERDRDAVTALLNGIGVEISKRQAVCLLAEPLDTIASEGAL